MENSEIQQTAPTADEVYISYPNKLQSEEKDENFEKTKAEIEKKFNDLLSTINEETGQLSEFLIEEKKLIQELCTFLRHILKRLNLTINIPLKAVPDLQTQATKIALNQEGHLIVTFEKERTDSKVLEDYSPEIVLSVIWNVIPELEKSIKAYRRKISERVGIFEKLRKDLKNIHNVFSAPDKDGSEIFMVGNEELKSPIAESENPPASSEKTE